ncbi:regulator of Vps4 activity in the MVB pathway-domain-containing protein [Mycena floridula]|nr:regulator of Vps4 activity in the MVB pathway-domain-containing protein [Mycena floridula]
MAQTKWDAVAIKAQLRRTSTSLNQMLEKKDAQGVARRDIATLLQQNNVGLARAKAQSLLRDDSLGDLLEVLEYYVGVITEHLPNLESSASPSPVVVEAASSIIYSAQYVDSHDLHLVRDILVQRFGPEFARSASRNHDFHVPLRILNAISRPPPSATDLDGYLTSIAKSYSVDWEPERPRQEISYILLDILESTSSPIVDLPRLQKLCSQGIPDEPAWLRPRIWKLFFSNLPVLKRSWPMAMQKQRESYYDLVRRLLEPFASLPAPSVPPIQLDVALRNVSDQLSRIPPSLFADLEQAPKSSVMCPLSSSALPERRITCANNLDDRIKVLRARNNSTPSEIPEIRLESSTEPASSDGSNRMLSNGGHAHPLHISALLRLLYLHSSINPGNISPHLPSLLVPIYVVLLQEKDPEDLAHVEADTFWLFESMAVPFGWVNSPSVLAWADDNLKKDLYAKGLDPGLPHYSYQWLAPILTQTLPLGSVIVAWDALFSRPTRQRDSNPKLDCLVDICTAMLLRAKEVLLRLGKGNQKSPALWSEDPQTIPPPSPLRAWELGDAFREGMALLQAYPIHAAGGIDKLLHTASYLGHRRDEEGRNSRHENLSLGARLKVTMWKGFTNQSSPDRSPYQSDEEEEEELSSMDEGNATETESQQTLGSRFASTVWRGITNQSSMEVPPSPISPGIHIPPDTPDESLSPRSRSIWGYAEKLKDSDAAAALSKASSNWKAATILGSWGRKAEPVSLDVPVMRDDRHRNSAPVMQGFGQDGQFDDRRVSLPGMDRSGVYSPPARPAHFRQPRDSVAFDSQNPPPIYPNQSDSGFMSKTKNLQASLAALTRSQTPPPAAPKAGPRPLLLNSSNLMSTTPRSRPISRSMNSTPTPDRQLQHFSRDSMSSVSSSSLSVSDAIHRQSRGSRSDWDSDTSSSKRVPINRGSVSPMASSFRRPLTPLMSGSSSGTSENGLASPRGTSVDGDTAPRGWGRVDMSDSPPLSLPRTPVSQTDPAVHVNGAETFRGSLVLDDPTDSPLQPPSIGRKLVRKKTPPPEMYQTSDTDSAAPVVSRSPRTRSKRHATRPANLKIQDPAKKESRPNSLVALSFDGDSPRRRKGSADDVERPRKVSTGSRTRKVSSETKNKKTREFPGEEGDDEGYDDLLSAYESEEMAL